MFRKILLSIACIGLALNGTIANAKDDKTQVSVGRFAGCETAPNEGSSSKYFEADVSDQGKEGFGILAPLVSALVSTGIDKIGGALKSKSEEKAKHYKDVVNHDGNKTLDIGNGLCIQFFVGEPSKLFLRDEADVYAEFYIRPYPAPDKAASSLAAAVSLEPTYFKFSKSGIGKSKRSGWAANFEFSKHGSDGETYNRTILLGDISKDEVLSTDLGEYLASGLLPNPFVIEKESETQNIRGAVIDRGAFSINVELVETRKSDAFFEFLSTSFDAAKDDVRDHLLIEVGLKKEEGESGVVGAGVTEDDIPS